MSDEITSNEELKAYVQNAAEPLTEACKAWARILPPHAELCPTYAQPKKTKRKAAKKVILRPSRNFDLQSWATSIAKASGLKGYDVVIPHPKRYYSPDLRAA